MRPEQPGRGPLDLDVLGLGQSLTEAAGRGVDGQDGGGGAVQDQGRLATRANRLHVSAEILDPGGDHGVGRYGSAGDRDTPAAGDCLLADPTAKIRVEVVEVREELRVPGITVTLCRSLDT